MEDDEHEDPKEGKGGVKKRSKQEAEDENEAPRSAKGKGHKKAEEEEDREPEEAPKPKVKARKSAQEEEEPDSTEHFEVSKARRKPCLRKAVEEEDGEQEEAPKPKGHPFTTPEPKRLGSAASLGTPSGLEAAMAYGLQLQADGSGEVTVSGLARKDSSGKLSRVTCLTDEQKELIRKMNDASELDVKERRMYYRALDRRMQDKDLPVGVLSKFHAAAGSHKKKQLGYVPGDGLYMYILYICI